MRRKETKSRDRQRGSRITDPFWRKAYTLYYEANFRANRDKLNFNLDPEWVYNNLINNCAVTGLKFEVQHTKKSNLSPSIDRINNDLGYTKNNCRLVIWWYNDTKGTLTDFDTWHFCNLVVNSSNMKHVLNAKETAKTPLEIT